MTRTHDASVAERFGSHAARYVDSPVHASGEDLDHFATLLAGRSTARLLDLGCGGGHVSFTASPLVSAVIAYDLSPDMLAVVAATAEARGLGNITGRQGSVESLPFADASFDVVASRFSAHHWHNVPPALAEARRVLKPGGLFVMMDAISPEHPLLSTAINTIELLRDTSHVRDYSVEEWLGMLRAAGFTPGEVIRRRLRLDFASWIARLSTPPALVTAIRAIQAEMPDDVIEHFAVEADGSFTLDTATLTAS